jgi:cytochrome P450
MGLAGSVVRIGPNQYSFVDPEAAKAIYAISTNFKKSTFYFPWGDPTAEQQNIFQVQDVKKHQEDRRKMAPMFSLTSLLSYEPYVDSSNEVLCRRLRGFAERDQTFDLVRWMQYYAFDVIGEITFSRTFGMMNRGADVAGILETIHMAAVIPAHLGIIPELTGAFHYITALLTKEHPFTSLNRYCEGATEARKAGKAPSDREDFLAKALKLVDAGKMDERLAHVTLLGNILAGSDTTGVTLSAILYYLIRNPHSMRKLQQELDEAAQSGKLSQPGTFSEASKLPYLQAVIKEGLRIHPAVGMQMPRVIPAGGKELAGHFFAANVGFRVLLIANSHPDL